VIRHGGNDKARMSNDERMTNSGERARVRFHSSFVIGHSSFRGSDGFTLIELLVVIAIIIVLAGLVLSTVGYVQKKGARSRAETEIAAMSAACESYKADNGIYPQDATTTDTLNARVSGDPTNPSYKQASLYLYTQLSGTNADRSLITGARSYFAFKPNQLSPSDQAQPVEFIRDPFGNSYGYSTAQAANPGGSAGYNPTFDLWSTAGLTSNPPGTPPDTITPQWIKNW
jgi:prepilin-type N-terminal cleavage/methylation domain-containing protein